MILDQALRNATIHELAHPPNPFNHTHPPGASTHNPAGDTSLLIDYGSPSIVHAPIRVGTDAKRLSAAMEDFKHGRPYTPAGINMARGASGRRGVVDTGNPSGEWGRDGYGGSSWAWAWV